MLQTFMIQSIKKLKANLKLIILHNNKLESIKDMDQNLLKASNLCMLKNALIIIIHCRISTPKSIEFRSKLGFNKYDIALTKEQSVLKSVIDAFE